LKNRMSVSQAFLDTCYTSYTDGQTATAPDGSSATIACPTDETGTTMAACAGITSVDAVMGGSCRSACAASVNQAACGSSARRYCSLNNANGDCACLRPQNKSFGTGSNIIQYNSLEDYVTAAGLGFAATCAWPACNPTLGYILVPTDVNASCPAASVTCSISGLTISLSNVVAQSIDLVSQQCGSSSIKSAASTNQTTTSASGKVGTSTVVTYAGLPASQWIIVGGVLAGIVVLTAVFVTLGVYATKLASIESKAESLVNAPRMVAVQQRARAAAATPKAPTKPAARPATTTRPVATAAKR
jgi:hypothetical protein